MAVSGHTVTVFGASGFLGRYLVNELGKSGSQVVVPYRGSPEDIRHLKVMGDLGQIVPLRVDVRDKESVMECLRHSDTVFNLIGRDYETRNFSFEAVHVDAARMIAKCAREAGVGRLIHVSALNTPQAEKFNSEILKSKAKGEQAVLDDFPGAVIVRPAQLFGWEDRLLQYFGRTQTHQVKRWATLGYIPMLDGGKRELQPAYVGDVARALHAIMQADAPERLYEFVGPDRFTHYQLVEMFCDYARRPFFPISLPYSVYRKLVSFTQKSPLARLTVHDIDRWQVNDQKLPETAGFDRLDIEPETMERLMIRFVRHFRPHGHVEEPGSLDELKLTHRVHRESNHA